MLHVPPKGVQESCVGRDLPGDLEHRGGPPAMIDRNPRTSWHCDGDGARLRPPQAVTIVFARTMTVSGVGVTGYDRLRSCRFVTEMTLEVKGLAYRLRLPAVPYRTPRWFAVPPVRSDRLELVVVRTTVPPGERGPGCSRTAIEEVGFAGHI
jgi:hypothetical protein